MRRRHLALSEALERRTLFAVPTVIGSAVNPANGHQYYLLSPSTRTEAEARANTLGGHLVKINNNAENSFVVNTFNSVTQVWIGLTDAVTEGTFVWADGGPSNFKKFHAGQPDDANNTDTEDFALMVISEGDWRDYFDTNLRNGIGINGVVEVSEPPRQNLTPTGTQMNEFYERTPTDLLLIFDDRTALSGDGRYVAFVAAGSNLVAGDTNDVNDVFVRDRNTGTVERVSVGSAGAEADGASGAPSISANGRYVAFASNATTIGSPGSGVFLYDRTNKTTERVFKLDTFVSIQSASNTFVSDDGRFVAFGDTVADRQNHTTKTVDARLGMSGDGKVLLGSTKITDNGVTTNFRGNGEGFNPAALSNNGRFIAYVAGGAPIVGDRQLGTSDFLPISVGNSIAISNDGRYVTYTTSNNEIGGDVNGQEDVYVFDRVTRQPALISRGLFGLAANGPSSKPSISDDGKFIAFTSRATNITVQDTNARPDIFVAERITGAQTIPAATDALRIVDDSDAVEDHSLSFPNTGPHVKRRRLMLINGTANDITFNEGNLSGTGTNDFLLDPSSDGFFQFYNNTSFGDGSPFIQNSFVISAFSSSFIDVTFVPTTTGHRTATLKLDFTRQVDNVDFSQNIALSGDAIAFPLKLTSPDSLPYTAFHKFGNVGIDTDADFDINVKNISNADVLLSDLLFSTGATFGSTAAWVLQPWFIGAPGNGKLAPGKSVIKRLKFTTGSNFIGNQGNPTGTSVGNNSPPATSGQITRDLIAMKIEDTDPSALLNDYSVSFPQTNVGATAGVTRIYTLTNTGDYDFNSTLPQNDNMAVTNFKLGDLNAADFSYVVKTNTGASLGAATSFTIPKGEDKAYTVEVKFKPKASVVAARKAKITFDLPNQDSDSANNKMTLLLKGIAKLNLSVIRVNAGGPDYIDAKGRTWKADTGFTGGSTATFSKTPIGTVDPLLMQKYRKGSSFNYNLPAVNGKYLLSLYFAEPMLTSVGARTFDVTAEDAPPLLAYDIFASAKSTTRKAKRIDFTVNIADGALSIAFVTVNGADAIVSAIELSPFPA